MTVTNHALTTIDNPYDVFEDFISWFLFDIEKGYDCCSIMGRLADIKDSYTEKETNDAIESAIDRFISLDFTDTYKKVSRTTEIEDVDDEE